MELTFKNCNEEFATLFTYVQNAKDRFGSSAASIIVIQDNKIIAEWYDGSHHFKSGALQVTQDSLFNIYSTRKTYVCLALATAIIDGGISIDTPIHKIVDDIPRDMLGETTIQDLLTATGPKYFGSEKVEREGLQGKVIEAITGNNIAQLLTEKVLKPLKFTQTEWITSPKENLVCDYTSSNGYASVRIESNEGHERNLYTNTRDLAYWGYLHLNKGYINEVQILPREIFDLTETLRKENTEKRILGWYHKKDWYYATGAAGCHCVVFPEFNAVGVRMFNRYTKNYKEDQIAFNSTLLNCLKEESLVNI
ncbi:serine hydrolase domain-containing protein [Sutcliffiella rhizosphaerae]|uniref:Beta-lactamase-related domain-containing protein n=1 Tax=Sutcliffiella rhizosphaerae TaxID=2880967 RepID=A0ABM8YRT1_9BACI|nr:serine hydrolase domain-containing protein [Sutcliffiella rhizosphaerae]CAG9622699.1 hypothetical protein BACCIP111883_03490 [Sutcliffiella rhizosphaerae]